KEIEDYQVKDTHRVNLIVKYFLYLEHSVPNNNIEPLLLEALEIARIKKYPLGIARCLNLLSLKYHQNSKLDTSMKMTLEAIEILEKLDGEPDDILDAYTNLSTIYITTQEFKKGLEINLKTLKIIESIEPTLSHARIYFYTALCYENLKMYKEAEKYLLQAKAIATKFNFPGGIIIANGSLAEMFNKLEKYEKAVPLVKETIFFAENAGQLPTLASSKYILGSSYLGLKQYNKAIKNFCDAMEISDQIGRKNLHDKIYKGLYNAYLEQGKYKQALDNYIMATQITDSLFNLEKNTILDDLKTKYGTNEIKKEKELAEANEKIAQQETESSNRQLLFSLFFSVIVLGLLFYIFNRLKLISKKNKELDEAYMLLEESKKYELAASNLKALKSQMNPHFIFNSLNSIQDLIIKNEKETSYDYIVLFAELVRSSLNNSNNDFIPIEEEIEFLEVYLKLEKLRFGEEFNYEIITNEVDDIYIPSLIIQPFLENALLHGLMHKKGDKKLTIEFKLDKELTCIITDNGVGRKEAKRIKDRRGNSHESFAMNSIKERLELLSERFNNNYEFKVEDLFEYDIPTGTRIILSIPFKEEYYPE
ncbi:MAG: tetratricopeptide repeat-containing sensor histidine kinase, partial [Flavobacteriales bacterium]